MTDAMEKYLSVARQDVAAVIEDLRLGCPETAVKHLTAMLAADSAEPVAWQYRLIGAWGTTKWRECNDDVRKMIAETGHYDGVDKVPAELRPLYDHGGLTPSKLEGFSAIAQERDVGEPVAWMWKGHEFAAAERLTFFKPDNHQADGEPIPLYASEAPGAAGVNPNNSEPSP